MQEEVLETTELGRLYEAGHRVARQNLRDISHEESLKPPPGGGNCINWVLGHLVATRQVVLRLAGGEAWWDEERSRTYSAGDDGRWSPDRALPLEVLIADYDRSQDLLARTLPALSAEALAAPGLLGTVGDTLAFLQFHEGYHAGQLGILRRVLGKPGVIKPPKLPRPA